MTRFIPTGSRERLTISFCDSDPSPEVAFQLSKGDQVDNNTDNIIVFVFCLSLLFNACSDLSRSNRLNDLEKEVAELKANSTCSK
jgi:hypothetical protein